MILTLQIFFWALNKKIKGPIHFLNFDLFENQVLDKSLKNEYFICFYRITVEHGD